MTASTQPESIPDADVGTRLRELRSSRGLSLRALAESSGVTASALSQIENGKNSPSVSTLKKVLGALGTTLGEFFAQEEPPDESGFVFRAVQMVNVASGRGLEYLSLPGATAGRALQIMDEHYAPRADTGPELYTHAGEEGGICIAGNIELTVNGRRETLGPGDGFYFSSSLPHRWRNVGKSPARMISACTPPSF
ncbi:MAG: cupin domain-containing protein [Planctomycetota bacterium]|jgi:transcriptional regulator with XRE-family HTH domain